MPWDVEFIPMLKFLGMLKKKDFKSLSERFNANRQEWVCIQIQNSKNANVRNFYLQNRGGKLHPQLEHPGNIDIMLITDTDTINAIFKRKREVLDPNTNRLVDIEYRPWDAYRLQHVIGSGTFSIAKARAFFQAFDEAVDEFDPLADEVVKD